MGSRQRYRRPRSTAAATWRGSRVEPERQFDAWEAALPDLFGPIHPYRTGGGSFPWSVRECLAGPVGFFRIDAPPHRVVYSGERGLDGGLVFLNLMVRGGGSASQADHEITQLPGDMFMLTGDRPFEKRFTAPFEQLCFTLPADLVSSRLADPGAMPAGRITGRSGLGAVLAATLTSLAEQIAQMDRAAAGAAATALSDLLGLALGSSGRRSRAVRHDHLRQAALDSVERHLADSELRPDLVASEISVSVRLLHQLFAEHGVSFGRWVLSRRLERCRQDLESPGWDHLTVAEIATRWGFVDPSHFSRAFRARYESAPGAFRHAAQLRHETS